jgi:hypothetical protein
LLTHFQKLEDRHNSMFCRLISMCGWLPMFNVIEIYKELVCWHLTIWSIHKPRPHPLFLHPKLKWKAFDEVKFMSTPICCNQLHLIVNTLTFNFLDLCKKNLLNKIGQGVGITCMEETFVPQKYGMEVIGHKNPI